MISPRGFDKLFYALDICTHSGKIFEILLAPTVCVVVVADVVEVDAVDIVSGELARHVADIFAVALVIEIYFIVISFTDIMPHTRLGMRFFIS